MKTTSTPSRSSRAAAKTGHLLKKFRHRRLELPDFVWEAIQREADYHRISLDWCLNEILREQLAKYAEEAKA
jgi:hypothetical protein